MSGYVRMYRDIIGNPQFRGKDDEYAAMWLILDAVWEDCAKRVGRQSVSLVRGQTAHAVEFFAKAWECSKSTAHSRLRHFEKCDFIRTEVRTGITVVTICNYDKYQAAPNDDRTTTERHPNAARTMPERCPNGLKEDNKLNEVKEVKELEHVGAYAFNGRVIKLKQSDFDAWKSAYHAIDLRAALMKVDAWLDANGGDNWFFRTSKWLENDHQKALQANKQPEPSHTTVEALTAVLGALNRQMAVDLINAAKSEEKALAVIEDARQDENPVEFVRRWIRKQATRKPELFAHLDPRDRPYVPAMGG